MVWSRAVNGRRGSFRRLVGSSPPLWKAAIALAAVAILVGRALLRRRVPEVQKLATSAMVVLAIVSVGNYYGFSTRPLVGATQFSGYDLLHYYLNAKYFDELGYVHLYEAMVAADDDLGGRYRRYRVRKVRDLDSSVSIPYAEIREKAEQTKALFSARRWRQFKHDFRFLQRTVPRRQQVQLFYDHGYNGTPFLQTIAGPLTNAVPVEKVKWLCHIETVLILLLFVVRARMRGLWVTAVAVCWYFTSFSARWPGIGQGLLRIDWFIALVLACLLMTGADPEPGVPVGRARTARLVGAGLLLAYSTMMKLFPILWLFGLGVRALWKIRTTRRLDRAAAIVLSTFAAGTLVLGAVAYRTVGEENVREFAEDIREHVDPANLSSQRMGFAIALAYRGELRDWGGRGKQQQKYALVGELSWLRWSGALLALLLLGLTIRPLDAKSPPTRTTAADATQLGFVPFYFLMIGSHYYWIHRLTMVVHHAPRTDDEREHLVGLAALFVIEAAAHAIDEWTDFRYATTATTSIALGLYCAWVIGARLRRARQSASSQTTSTPTT